MTLDAARIDLRRAFVEGMGYVALSRLRRLDTLELAGINQMALKVSPEALLIDETLRRASQQANSRFGHLRDKAREREQIGVKAAAGRPANNWAEKVAKMRKSYPKAYMPWQKAEDNKLIQLFQDGNAHTIKELTEAFGRHPSAIRLRLQKHFGEDAVELSNLAADRPE